jgi:hypothetical protein
LNDIGDIKLSSARSEIQNIIGTKRPPSLQKNEIVEGRVLDSRSPQNAVLLIKGKKVVVRTVFPLQQGDVSLLKVEQVIPQTVLKVVSLHRPLGNGPVSFLVTTSGSYSPYQFIAKLLSRFASLHISATGSEVHAIVSDLKSLMTKIALQSPINATPNFLKILIDGSGLTWEHKLKQLLCNGKPSSHDIHMLPQNDLKGLTMRLLQGWNSMDILSREEIQGCVDSLEQLQLLNHAALEERGKLFFLFPIQQEDSFNLGQLLIRLPNNGKKAHAKEEEDAVRISFLLQMSHLGSVRADMSIVNKTIRGRFLVPNPQVQSLLEEHIEALKARFLQAGFFVHEFVCALEKMEVLESTSLVEELINREERFLSLVV